VDCNVKVNSVDALKLLRYGAGLSYSHPESCPDIGTGILTNGVKQGNVDCNGTVNSVDALKLLRYGAGLSYSHPESCPNIGS
jgi:hypothetical protein